jgi:hypothetical protein
LCITFILAGVTKSYWMPFQDEKNPVKTRQDKTIITRKDTKTRQDNHKTRYGNHKTRQDNHKKGQDKARQDNNNDNGKARRKTRQSEDKGITRQEKTRQPHDNHKTREIHGNRKTITSQSQD